MKNKQYFVVCNVWFHFIPTYSLPYDFLYMLDLTIDCLIRLDATGRYTGNNWLEGQTLKSIKFTICRKPNV